MPRAITEDDMTLNLRYHRAQILTAHVMNVVGKYITNHEDDYMRKASQDLFVVFYEEGVEIVTDAVRAQVGLPLRGDKGWTEQELHVLETRRLELMLNPVQPILARE